MAKKLSEVRPLVRCLHSPSGFNRSLTGTSNDKEPKRKHNVLYRHVSLTCCFTRRYIKIKAMHFLNASV
nr:hypothetical protein [Raoultella ornithinolytica]